MSHTAKKDYLDMVTNPDRFKSYAAMKGTTRTGSGSRPQSVQPQSQIQPPVLEDTNDMDVKINTDVDMDTGTDTLEPNEQTQRQPPPTSYKPDNTNTNSSTLASRLEEAAILKEKRDAETKLQKDRQRELEL